MVQLLSDLMTNEAFQQEIPTVMGILGTWDIFFYTIG